ncbi:MAG: urease accessory protein UreD [Pseudomonadota bacterium]
MQRSIGEGRLATKASDGKTQILDLYQKSNAKIRIPKSYDQSLEAVLINTSGGMTGGDQLSWEIEAGKSSHAIITTQACEKIYKSEAGTAYIQSTIKVDENASVEWLPQETILFDEGRLQRSIDIQLANSAHFIGLEAVVLGRQAMGEPARNIKLSDKWRIKRDGKLIHADDVKMNGNIEKLISHQSVLDGAASFATLVICLPDAQQSRSELLIGAMRNAITPNANWSVSGMADKIVARFVAQDMYALRQTLVPVLTAARESRDIPKVWRL